MNGSVPMNRSSFSSGIASVPRRVNPSDLHEPVFSPAVRFAPKELSPSQAITRIAYWACIIALVLVMGRSGFSYVRQIWPERPATTLSSKTKPYEY
jgi:hypothetical protein